MYMGVVWEIVNSISDPCTCFFLPDLYHNTFILMYSHVLRWMAIQVRCHGLNETVTTRRYRCHGLPFARRQAQISFYPPNQPAFGIANGAAHLRVRGPVTPHPCLRQPGLTKA